MNKEEIITEVEKIFKEVTGNNDLAISEKTIIGGSIGDDILQISSIDFVQVVVEIEERFNVVIDFDLPLGSVEDIITLIEHGEK